MVQVIWKYIYTTANSDKQTPLVYTPNSYDNTNSVQQFYLRSKHYLILYRVIPHMRIYFSNHFIYCCYSVVKLFEYSAGQFNKPRYSMSAIFSIQSPSIYQISTISIFNICGNLQVDIKEMNCRSSICRFQLSSLIH